VTVIRAIWKTVRGFALLLLLALVFAGVLLVSCLARLCFGDGASDIAGKLRVSS